MPTALLTPLHISRGIHPTHEPEKPLWLIPSVPDRCWQRPHKMRTRECAWQLPKELTFRTICDYGWWRTQIRWYTLWPSNTPMCLYRR